MKAAGQDYSGEYGFAPTDMHWKVDHMVSPKSDALKCNDCHGKDGRMDWKALAYAGDPRSAKKYALATSNAKRAGFRPASITP